MLIDRERRGNNYYYHLIIDSDIVKFHGWYTINELLKLEYPDGRKISVVPYHTLHTRISETFRKDSRPGTNNTLWACMTNALNHKYMVKPRLNIETRPIIEDKNYLDILNLFRPGSLSHTVR